MFPNRERKGSLLYENSINQYKYFKSILFFSIASHTRFYLSSIFVINECTLIFSAENLSPDMEAGDNDTSNQEIVLRCFAGANGVVVHK